MSDRKKRAQELRGQMALLTALALSPNGISQFLDSPTKKEKQCRLPRCEEVTSHNGGYCCAEHCKEHRREACE